VRQDLVMAITNNINDQLTDEEIKYLQQLLLERTSSPVAFRTKYMIALRESKDFFDVHVSPSNKVVCPCCRR
jgi:hypothetical protein